MKTAFARWLQDREIAPHKFAAEHGIHRALIMRLAGIRARWDKTPVDQIRWYTAPGKVATITGIPLEKLISDAIMAMQDPAEPRKYQRKGSDNGSVQGRA